MTDSLYPLTQWTVNDQNPAGQSENVMLHNSAFVTPAGNLINLSQKRDDFCMPFQSRCIGKLASSPEHLVRLAQDLRGNREAKSLGRLEVDGELELRGPLHGEVTRLRSVQHFVHEDSGVMIHFAMIWRIGHETSRLGIGAHPTAGG